MFNLRWAVPELFLENQLNFIFGSTGAGKTTLALQIFDDLSAGRPTIFGRETIQTAACMVSCEHTIALLRAHMAQVGVSLTLPHLSLIGLLNPTTNEFTFEAAMEIVLRRFPDTRVVFFDGFSNLCPGKITEHRDVTQFLIGCKQYMQHHDITVVGTVPTCKLKEGGGYINPFERIVGSGAFASQAATKALIAERSG